MKKMIAEMKAHGLVGMEAIYSENTAADEGDFKSLARAEDLLITGGSDFHGENKPDIRLGKGRGRLYVPYACLEAVRLARG